VLSDLLVLEAFSYLFLTLRLIPVMIVAPVLGDESVPTRFKTAFIFVFPLAIGPALLDKVPPIPETLYGLLGIVLYEFLIGFMIALSARMLMSAAHTAGTVMAFQTGLAAAQSFDPSQGGQTAILSSFMTITAVTLLVITDVHHLLIFGIVNSYSTFPVAEALPVADFASVVLHFVSQSFVLAIQISAPFIAYAFIFNVGLGLMARLAPRIQVFFVAMPLNIYFGFTLFALLLPSIMWLFLDHFRELLVQFLP